MFNIKWTKKTFQFLIKKANKKIGIIFNLPYIFIKAIIKNMNNKDILKQKLIQMFKKTTFFLKQTHVQL